MTYIELYTRDINEINGDSEMVKIGDKFVKRGDKQKRVNTVVDIMTITNSKGEVVKQYAVSESELMGQTVTNYEVPFATVELGRV